MDSSRPSPGAALSAPPPVAVSRRDQLLVASCLLLITLLAWTYLLHLDRGMPAAAPQGVMPGMRMPGDAHWSATDVVLTFTMWTVMMVGMMSAAAAPVLLLFASAQAARGAGRSPAAVLPFAGGYLAVWAGFSACAALAQWGLHEAALLSPAMAFANPRFSAALLILAGGYQLTPWKHACLAHCRSPLAFLMSHWRDGRVGAFRMGAHHGIYCLGCCWALMGVLFVVGVMNLLWIALLSALVLMEKLGPGGVMAGRLSGVALLAAGALMLLG